MSTSLLTTSVLCKEHGNLYLQTWPLLLSSRPITPTLTWYFHADVSKAAHDQQAPSLTPYMWSFFGVFCLRGQHHCSSHHTSQKSQSYFWYLFILYILSPIYRQRLFLFPPKSFSNPPTALDLQLTALAQVNIIICRDYCYGLGYPTCNQSPSSPGPTEHL